MSGRASTDSRLGASSSSSNKHIKMDLCTYSLTDKATVMDSNLQLQMEWMENDLDDIAKQKLKYLDDKNKVVEKIIQMEIEIKDLNTKESELSITIDQLTQKQVNLKQNMASFIQTHNHHHSYYKYCKYLITSDPESNVLWYFNRDGSCCVCLEAYRNVTKINHCQHRMCESCLLGVLVNSDECPQCRQHIVSYETFDTRTMTTRYHVPNYEMRFFTFADLPYPVPQTELDNNVDGATRNIGTTMREMNDILNGHVDTRM